MDAICGIMHLRGLDEKGQAVALSHPHPGSLLSPGLAARTPELSLDAHLSFRPASGCHFGPRAEHGFAAHFHAVALREPDPEEGLADLDHGRHADQDEAPWRRDDEDGEDDRDDENHVAGCNTARFFGIM